MALDLQRQWWQVALLILWRSLNRPHLPSPLFQRPYGRGAPRETLRAGREDQDAAQFAGAALAPKPFSRFDRIGLNPNQIRRTRVGRAPHIIDPTMESKAMTPQF